MRAKILLLLILLFSINQCFVSTSRILIICPSPAISHQSVFHSVTLGLLKKGHELVLLTTNLIDLSSDKELSPAMIKNLQQVDASFAYKGQIDDIASKASSEKRMALLKYITNKIDALEELLDKELSLPEMQNLIKNENEKFHAVIVEYLSHTPMYAFAKHFNAPLIGLTSFAATFNDHMAVGNYINSVIHPLSIFHNYKDLSFLERFASVTLDNVLHFTYQPYIYGKYDKLIEKHFGDSVPRSKELAQLADLLIINEHPALGYVRPIVPITVQTGFLHVKPSKPLPDDLQQYMDESKHGVIYFSFGTSVKANNIKNSTYKIFLDVFKELKYDVLWKFDNVVDGLPANVKTISWVPQQDLLAHPKLKLFITQGGHQSIEESIDRQVPMVVIPILGDQFVNARRIEDKNLGLGLKLNEITVDSLKRSILEVIEHPKYKENIVKLSKIVKDEPMSPVDKAVWWIEYTIRHNGTKHLRYPGLAIPKYQIYYLDVIFAYILILTIIFLLIKFLIKFLIKIVRYVTSKLFYGKKVKQQ